MCVCVCVCCFPPSSYKAFHTVLYYFAKEGWFESFQTKKNINWCFLCGRYCVNLRLMNKGNGILIPWFIKKKYGTRKIRIYIFYLQKYKPWRTELTHTFLWWDEGHRVRDSNADVIITAKRKCVIRKETEHKCIYIC